MGGYKTGGGEACEVLPLLKKRGGGDEKVLAMLKGMGAQQVLGEFICDSLKFCHIEEGGGHK